MVMYNGAMRLGPPLSERLNGALRPSVEALLLAAVALGCAQAGWMLLAPGQANASVSANGESQSDLLVEASEVRSPFSPDATDAAGHAVSAALSSLQLKGLRMASDPLRSGAMFTMPDGGQRAFLIGQEVVAGVVLDEVGVDYVSLSYAGGERRLDMSAAPEFSFARAMMGLQPAPGAPPLAVIIDSASVPAAISADDRAWLAQSLARVETGADGVRGWRVDGSMPDAVAGAGLRAGDLVVSVNGHGADDLAGVIAAARTSHIVLEIERAGIRQSLALEVGGAL